ncbi:hypothetical protein HMPREF6745_3037 [Prevotella sp. oral taxon 472 str. F0295]|nr:hypothetical protein HMPREF6745_3037 [Prevotella sp. oral taxon 472 str. F0295]
MTRSLSTLQQSIWLNFLTQTSVDKFTSKLVDKDVIRTATKHLA